MGRPRKTTQQHELSGSFDTHPERKAARALEPIPHGPLGASPACFTAAGGCPEEESERLVAIWDEIVSEVPPGVLTICDRKHLELACRLLNRIRKDLGKSGDYSRLDVLLGKMGMNPSDRSKVSVVPGSKPTDGEVSNPFDAIATETRPN